jgi:hypothetical protein
MVCSRDKMPIMPQSMASNGGHLPLVVSRSDNDDMASRRELSDGPDIKVSETKLPGQRHGQAPLIWPCRPHYHLVGLYY